MGRAVMVGRFALNPNPWLPVFPEQPRVLTVPLPLPTQPGPPTGSPGLILSPRHGPEREQFAQGHTAS